jgi:hypothetical protein
MSGIRTRSDFGHAQRHAPEATCFSKKDSWYMKRQMDLLVMAKARRPVTLKARAGAVKEKANLRARR